MHTSPRVTSVASALALSFAPLFAVESDPVEAVIVTGRADSMLGIAASSNEGVIGHDQIALRPLLRVGEIVETIPGVIVLLNMFQPNSFTGSHNSSSPTCCALALRRRLL